MNSVFGTSGVNGHGKGLRGVVAYRQNLRELLQLKKRQMVEIIKG